MHFPGFPGQNHFLYLQLQAWIIAYSHIIYTINNNVQCRYILQDFDNDLIQLHLKTLYNSVIKPAYIIQLGTYLVLNFTRISEA